MVRIATHSLRSAVLKSAAVLLVTFAGTAVAQTRAQQVVHTGDVVVGYVAEHSLRSTTGQSFWLSGGSIEAGTVLSRGFGAAINVTGAATDHVGTNGVPLSLVTVTIGPRYRLNEHGRFSPFGEALIGAAHGFNSTFPLQGGATSSAGSFALHTGVGLDVAVGKRMVIRPVDVSYVRTMLPNGTNGVQNTLRVGFSVGLAFGR